MKTVHLISFNVPLPADYGGVIDVFYKIKALNEAGIKVILHCFHYGRNEAKDLEDISLKVFYYKRQTGILQNLSFLPYIVASRYSELLFFNLKKDNYPIIFDGIHTTALVKKVFGNNRTLILRAHNIEHDYYDGLYLAEKKFYNKLYYYIESYKLKKYEKKIMLYLSGIAAISPSDYEYFTSIHNNVKYIPAFHSNNSFNVKSGIGNYVLFHGNLSVPENHKAAVFLINNVFAFLNIPALIAGKDPLPELYKEAEINNHIKIVANPTLEEMNRLIVNAQVIVLVTFQDTGIKLKLLSSLFNGRHCIVNSLMVSNTELSKYCHVIDDPKQYIKKIEELMTISISEKEINDRKYCLHNIMSNSINANKLIEMVF